MKLYAVVIGKFKKNRYVAFYKGTKNLAVFDLRQEAILYKKEVLKECGHKSVFVKRFIVG